MSKRSKQRNRRNAVGRAIQIAQQPSENRKPSEYDDRSGSISVSAPQAVPQPEPTTTPKPSDKSRFDLFWDRLTKICAGVAAIIAAIRQLLFFW